MRVAMLTLGLCLLAGCASDALRMDVPADLALHGDEIPVASRLVRTGKSPVQFGRYRTAAHYGWSLPTTTTSGHRDDLSLGRERMRFGFTLQDAGRDGPQARCNASQRFVRIGDTESHVDLAVEANTPVLSCEIGAGNLDLWQRDGSIGGELVSPGKTPMVIRADTTAPGIAWVGGNPFGYVFSADGRDLMAVDLSKPGRVWLDRSLDDATRASLAAAAAALLMTQ